MNGSANLNKLALDSNIFIYYFERHPQFGPMAKMIFNNLVSQKWKAITSIVSLSELLSYPQTARNQESLIESFFATPNLQVYEIDREIAIQAAQIRRMYPLRLPDAFQLATALQAKAEVFVTNDKRLKQMKGIKVLTLEEIKL